MIRYNSLTVKVLQPSSTDVVPDLNNELKLINGPRLTKGVDGVNLSASFLLQRLTLSVSPYRDGQTVVLYNNTAPVWEGEIVNIGFSVSPQGTQLNFECIGDYGQTLERNYINKRWVDTRLDGDTWVLPTDSSGVGNNQELIRVRRRNTIEIVPQKEPWQEDEYSKLVYTMPTGEVVRRVVADITLGETAVVTPKFARFQNNAGTFSDLLNTIDDDPATFDTITVDGASAHIYVGFTEAIGTNGGLRFTLGASVNAVASTMPDVEYTNTSTTFAPLTITDGTASGGSTLAQSGDVQFTDPSEIVDITRFRLDPSGNAQSAFWYRVDFAGTFPYNAVDIVAIDLVEFQDWQVDLYNVATATVIASATTDGTTNIDISFLPAQETQEIEARFISKAAQAPPSNGSIFASLFNVEIYSELGSITLPEIAKDILSLVPDLNSSELFIDDGNTKELIPFVTDGYESVGSVLRRAASAGDQNSNLWYARLISRFKVPSPDGKPVLQVDQSPLNTDAFDLAIRLDEENLSGSLELSIDTSGVVNDVIVEYQNEDGGTVYVTSDDDSSLKDDDSIALFKTKQLPITVNTTSQSEAVAAGVAFLEANKFAEVSTLSPIVVVGYIRNPNSVSLLPVSQIEPLQRLEIQNFSLDIQGVNSTRVRGTVTYIEYDDATQTAAITLTRNSDLTLLTV